MTDKVLGVIAISRNTGTGQITAVNLSEAGTIDAGTELENIELWLSYDATWNSGDNQLGSTGTFSGPDGAVTFTETWSATSSAQYLIVRGDVVSGYRRRHYRDQSFLSCYDRHSGRDTF